MIDMFTNMKRIVLALLVLGVLVALTPCAHAATWNALMNRLVADGFDPAGIRSLFKGVTYDPAPMSDKIHSLYVIKFGSGLAREIQKELNTLGYQPGLADGYAGSKTRAAIRGFQKAHGLEVDGQVNEALLEYIKTHGRHAPRGYKPPPLLKKDRGPAIYKSVVTPERLAEAKEFYDANLPLLQKVEATYGIPPEIAVGILTVETRVGKFLGRESAFRTLASMAATREYADVKAVFIREHPSGKSLAWLVKRMRQKADWAYDELKALLRYSIAKGADPRTLPGSIYGAIGISQFMPSNALRFGVDGDGDGRVDLFTVDDALHSMGNYLKAHGWKPAKTRRGQRQVLYRYNHSVTYVNTIMAVADFLR